MIFDVFPSFLCHTFDLSKDVQIVALCVSAQGRLRILRIHLSAQISVKQPEVFGGFCSSFTVVGHGHILSK